MERRTRRDRCSMLCTPRAIDDANRRTRRCMQVHAVNLTQNGDSVHWRTSSSSHVCWGAHNSHTARVHAIRTHYHNANNPALHGPTGKLRRRRSPPTGNTQNSHSLVLHQRAACLKPAHICKATRHFRRSLESCLMSNATPLVVCAHPA